jgi:hypothetical protein
VSVSQMETEDNWDDLYSHSPMEEEVGNVESIQRAILEEMDDWLNGADGEVWDTNAGSQADGSSG